MYFINASLNRSESSMFALSSSDESKLILIDGRGNPNHEHIIRKLGQDFSYFCRKLRRSASLNSITV